MSVDLEWDRDFALEQSGGDEGMLAEMLDLLRESAAADLSRIRDAIGNGDADGLMLAAHSLKGAAASMAVEKLRAAAYELECAGREGRLDVEEQVARLDGLIAALGRLS